MFSPVSCQSNQGTVRLSELKDLRDHLGQRPIFIERRSSELNSLLQLIGDRARFRATQASWFSAL